MPTPAFDLDALEKEGRPEPLTFTFRGRTFTFLDPLLIPWSVYEDLDWEDTAAVLKAILSPEDYEAFSALEVSQHAVNILSERIGKHYLPGEASGSPAS